VEVDTPDATPDAPVTIVTPPVEVETVTPAPLPTGPALDVFAASFENPDDKPLIAIALLDDGAMNGAVTAVTSLPFAVTVVMNPDLPDVAQRMADYRAAGVEVAVQASLPTGAAASDIEVALEGTFSQINQAVMLVDTGAGGLQGDRSATEQTMARLATDGRGFLTASKGLNATIRAAEKAGVPATTIFRDLDADGQDARVIRRFLDQAAFRARQESGVVDDFHCTDLGRTRHRASGHSGKKGRQAIFTLCQLTHDVGHNVHDVEHIGRRVRAPQRPVKREWRFAEILGPALCWHNLKNITGADVILGFFHRVQIPLMGEIGCGGGDFMCI